MKPLIRFVNKHWQFLTVSFTAIAYASTQVTQWFALVSEIDKHEFREFIPLLIFFAVLGSLILFGVAYELRSQPSTRLILSEDKAAGKQELRFNLSGAVALFVALILTISFFVLTPPKDRRERITFIYLSKSSDPTARSASNTLAEMFSNALKPYDKRAFFDPIDTDMVPELTPAKTYARSHGCSVVVYGYCNRPGGAPDASIGIKFALGRKDSSEVFNFLGRTFHIPYANNDSLLEASVRINSRDIILPKKAELLSASSSLPVLPKISSFVPLSLLFETVVACQSGNSREMDSLVGALLGFNDSLHFSRSSAICRMRGDVALGAHAILEAYRWYYRAKLYDLQYSLVDPFWVRFKESFDSMMQLEYACKGEERAIADSDLPGVYGEGYWQQYDNIFDEMLVRDTEDVGPRYAANVPLEVTFPGKALSPSTRSREEMLRTLNGKYCSLKVFNVIGRRFANFHPFGYYRFHISGDRITLSQGQKIVFRGEFELVAKTHETPLENDFVHDTCGIWAARGVLTLDPVFAETVGVSDSASLEFLLPGQLPDSVQTRWGRIILKQPHEKPSSTPYFVENGRLYSHIPLYLEMCKFRSAPNTGESKNEMVAAALWVKDSVLSR